MQEKAEIPLELQLLRNKIDRVDDAILHLVEQRMQLAIAVGAMKRKYQFDSYLQPNREMQIIQRLLDQKASLMPNEFVETLFKRLIEISRKLQESPKVAFLGPIGSYSHMAALAYFGEFLHAEPVLSIAEIFEAVSSNQVHFGIVPYENSIAGVVSESQIMLKQTGLSEVDKYDMNIDHCLLSHQKSLPEIKCVYAHRMTFKQCQNWLAVNLSDAEKIEVASNGEAARLASLESNSAAIASEFAASIYSLARLENNIADSANNQTRFIIITNEIKDFI